MKKLREEIEKLDAISVGERYAFAQKWAKTLSKRRIITNGDTFTLVFLPDGRICRLDNIDIEDWYECYDGSEDKLIPLSPEEFEELWEKSKVYEAMAKAMGSALASAIGGY